MYYERLMASCLAAANGRVGIPWRKDNETSPSEQGPKYYLTELLTIYDDIRGHGLKPSKKAFSCALTAAISLQWPAKVCCPSVASCDKCCFPGL
jgi:hypothetical protein